MSQFITFISQVYPMKPFPLRSVVSVGCLYITKMPVETKLYQDSDLRMKPAPFVQTGSLISFLIYSGMQAFCHDALVVLHLEILSRRVLYSWTWT